MKYPYVLCAYPRDFRQTGKGSKKVGKFADLHEAETCGEALLALQDDFNLPKYERYFVYDRQDGAHVAGGLSQLLQTV